MKPDEICKNCTYYNRLGGHSLDTGECRKHSPRTGSDMFDPNRYPIVDETDWCGDFDTGSVPYYIHDNKEGE